MGSPVSQWTGNVMNQHMYAEVLGARQLKLLKAVSMAMTHAGLYLAGGTAVALHLGHRHSIDLDFFSSQAVQPEIIAELLNTHAKFETKSVGAGTLHGLANSVKVSVIEYRYPLLEPVVMWPEVACQLASPADLACMKLVAITQRGTKKDFVDLYALGQNTFTLQEMLTLYRRKYQIVDQAHVLYALGYFEDADAEEMPRMFWDVDWRKIKRTIENWLRELA
jgi:predicted nucleotidyltransferase component of viral defense system